MKKPIWLDTDPGHDDAIAILLALNCPDIDLLGISTVHGNTTAENTWSNAVRLLYAFGDPHHKAKVYAGASKPLLRPARADPEIHGPDGLGGVEGLPSCTHPSVQARVKGGGRDLVAIEAIAAALRKTWDGGQGQRTTIVTTGPQTNLALFLSVYPDLEPAIEEIVFMGGAVGIGNRSAVAEYNILCDPEASQIVLNFPVRKVMVPINVTHKVIFTRAIHARLLDPYMTYDREADSLPQPVTPLRHVLSTLITFFAETYKSTFGFQDGPPLHDALTIAYVVHPERFQCKRWRVDVELDGKHSLGSTVVDVWNYQKSNDNSWGSDGKNCIVVEDIDVPWFFDFLLENIQICEMISPLNNGNQ